MGVPQLCGRDGYFQLLLAPCPPPTPVPELGWLGLEKFQGRRRQPCLADKPGAESYRKKGPKISF